MILADRPIANDLRVSINPADLLAAQIIAAIPPLVSVIEILNCIAAGAVTLRELL